MGFIKNFRRDFAQAVNELLPEGEEKNTRKKKDQRQEVPEPQTLQPEAAAPIQEEYHDTNVQDAVSEAILREEADQLREEIRQNTEQRMEQMSRELDEEIDAYPEVPAEDGTESAESDAAALPVYGGEDSAVQAVYGGEYPGGQPVYNGNEYPTGQPVYGGENPAGQPVNNGNGYSAPQPAYGALYNENSSYHGNAVSGETSVEMSSEAEYGTSEGSHTAAEYGMPEGSHAAEEYGTSEGSYAAAEYGASEGSNSSKKYGSEEESHTTEKYGTAEESPREEEAEEDTEEEITEVPSVEATEEEREVSRLAELEAQAGLDEAITGLAADCTYITAKTKIKGDIETDGDIDLIGSVTGNVTCLGKLIVGGSISGEVKAGELYANQSKIEGPINVTESVKIGVGSVIIGKITATSAVIAGAVNGDIDVQGPVIVDSSAVIVGNIKSKSVQINNGAIIEGFCSQAYLDVDVKKYFATDDTRVETGDAKIEELSPEAQAEDSKSEKNSSETQTEDVKEAVSDKLSREENSHQNGNKKRNRNQNHSGNNKN